MKKRRIFTIAIALVLALVVATVAYAAFGGSSLTATGAVDVVANEAYTLSSPVLDFDTTIVGTGTAISVDATINVTNTGLVDIAGFTLTGVNGVSATGIIGGALAVTSVPVPAGTTVAVTFTLTGTAPATIGSLNLNTVVCVLNPPP